MIKLMTKKKKVLKSKKKKILRGLVTYLEAFYEMFTSV